MKPGPSTLWPTVAPQWILNLPQSIEDIFYDFYKSFFYDNRYELYLDGLVNTLLLTLMALVLGVAIGVVIALVRSTWDKNNGELRGVTLRDLKTEREFNLPVEGLFLAVGQEPHNGQFADLIRLTAGGYVDAGEDCRTNVPGVFVAGDCRVKEVRQLTTAVGDGAVAALAACKYVDSL